MKLLQMILEENISAAMDLILGGHDVNETDINGQTPLMVASGLKQNMLLRPLIAAGADLNAADIDRELALHRCAAAGNAEGVFILLEAGANIDSVNADGKSPLMLAAIMGELATCKALLDLGANMHMTDMLGRNALHWAVMRNDDSELAELLIEAGISPSLPDRAGMTPKALALAVKHQNAANAITRNVITRT